MGHFLQQKVNRLKAQVHCCRGLFAIYLLLKSDRLAPWASAEGFPSAGFRRTSLKKLLMLEYWIPSFKVVSLVETPLAFLTARFARSVRRGCFCYKTRLPIECRIRRTATFSGLFFIDFFSKCVILSIERTSAVCRTVVDRFESFLTLRTTCVLSFFYFTGT